MNGQIGIIVDEVKEVVTLESDQIEKIAYDSKEEKDGFLCGVGKCAGGLISLLDLNSRMMIRLDFVSSSGSSPILMRILITGITSPRRFGATVLGDGEVALILDANTLI